MDEEYNIYLKEKKVGKKNNIKPTIKESKRMDNETEIPTMKMKNK